MNQKLEKGRWYDFRVVYRKDGGDAKAARKGERPVFMGTEYRPVAVYDRDKLGRGHELVGPVLVESAHTTVYISEGWKMRIDRYNNAVVEGL